MDAISTLVINTTLKQLPDREMARVGKVWKTSCQPAGRTEPKQGDLAELQETEKEAADKQAEAINPNDWTNAECGLIEKMRQLADRCRTSNDS